MDAYSEKEIELARRIYDATMLVSDRITYRKAKNLSKKYGFLPPEEIPDDFSLKIARSLLEHYEEQLQKSIRQIIESM